MSNLKNRGKIRADKVPKIDFTNFKILGFQLIFDNRIESESKSNNAESLSNLKNHIFSEWEDVMRRKDISEEEIKKRVSKAQLAFPDALVDNYEPLVESLTLPDENDRHVLAAAIKTNANIASKILI